MTSPSILSNVKSSAKPITQESTTLSSGSGFFDPIENRQSRKGGQHGYNRKMVTTIAVEKKMYRGPVKNCRQQKVTGWVS